MVVLTTSQNVIKITLVLLDLEVQSRNLRDAPCMYERKHKKVAEKIRPDVGLIIQWFVL